MMDFFVVLELQSIYPYLDTALALGSYFTLIIVHCFAPHFIHLKHFDLILTSKLQSEDYLFQNSNLVDQVGLLLF